MKLQLKGRHTYIAYQHGPHHVQIGFCVCEITHVTSKQQMKDKRKYTKTNRFAIKLIHHTWSLHCFTSSGYKFQLLIHTIITQKI